MFLHICTMKDLNTFVLTESNFLRILNERDVERRIVYLHQQDFIMKMLEKFKMNGCKQESFGWCKS